MCPPDLPFNSRNWHCVLDSSELYRMILHLVYLGYCIHIQNIYIHLLVTRSTTTYPIKWRSFGHQIQCPTLSLDMFRFRYRHPIAAYDMSLSGYRLGARFIHSHILSIWVSILTIVSVVQHSIINIVSNPSRDLILINHRSNKIHIKLYI